MKEAQWVERWLAHTPDDRLPEGSYPTPEPSWEDSDEALIVWIETNAHLLRSERLNELEAATEEAIARASDGWQEAEEAMAAMLPGLLPGEREALLAALPETGKPDVGPLCAALNRGASRTLQILLAAAIEGKHLHHRGDASETASIRSGETLMRYYLVLAGLDWLFGSQKAAQSDQPARGRGRPRKGEERPPPVPRPRAVARKDRTERARRLTLKMIGQPADEASLRALEDHVRNPSEAGHQPQLSARLLRDTIRAAPSAPEK